FQFALATAVMVALGFILLPRPQTPAKPPVAVHKSIPNVVPGVPAIEVAQVPPVKPLPKPRRKPERLVASSGGPPPDSEITMKTQTPDPNAPPLWDPHQKGK